MQGVGGALVPVRRVVTVVFISGEQYVAAHTPRQRVATSAPHQPIIARVTIENVVLVVQASQIVIARRAIDDQAGAVQHRLTPDRAVSKHYLLDARGDVTVPALDRDLVTRIGKAQHQVRAGARYRHVRRRYSGAQHDAVSAAVLHTPVLHGDVARLGDRVGTIAQVVHVGVRSTASIQLVAARATLQGVGGPFVVVRCGVAEVQVPCKQRVVARASIYCVAVSTSGQPIIAYRPYKRV